MKGEKHKNKFLVYTAATRSFIGGQDTFSRDCGLICKELQKMGIASKLVLPLPRKEGEWTEDLLRVEYKKMKSSDWWKSLGIEGVILYSWGAPQYLPVARAIHRAGIKLVIHFDTAGNFFRYLDGCSLVQKMFIRLKEVCINILRRKHLSYADVITCSTPVITKLRESIYYGEKIAQKCIEMPGPISQHFSYDGTAKKNHIICVGRWNAEVKRPDFLMQTVSALYTMGCKAHVYIYGPTTQKMMDWQENLPDEAKEFVHVMGLVPNHILPEVYKKSRMVFCTSRSEGSHLASAEGLCSGCSVVTTPRRELNVLASYTTKNSGRIAKEDTPESLAEALMEELQAWELGERQAEKIAAAWQASFHVNQILPKLFPGI